jgi:hypothetical protein
VGGRGGAGEERGGTEGVDEGRETSKLGVTSVQDGGPKIVRDEGAEISGE